MLQAPHVLQAAPQKKIHDQAWQPFSGYTLAVAHEDGVSLWRHVDQACSPAMHRVHLQKGAPLAPNIIAPAVCAGCPVPVDPLNTSAELSDADALLDLHADCSVATGTLSPYIHIKLPWPSTAAATALAWHPKGSMLAAASLRDNCLFVWDNGLVRHEPERVSLPGSTGTHLLRWSPCGHYLFVGTAHASTALPLCAKRWSLG